MTTPSAGKNETLLVKLGVQLIFFAALFLAGAFVVGLCAAAGHASTTTPRAGALIRIGSGEPPLYTAAPGEEITITVEVTAAANLGAATVLLNYDPTLVQVVACTALGLADADLIACNPAYANGVVRYTLATSAGLNGAFPLFSVTLRAVGAAGATAQLALAAPQFTDTHGGDLPMTTAGGAIAIAGAPLPVDATVRLIDQHSAIMPGQNLVVSVWVDVTDTRPLAAATFVLQYDPQLVRPVQCVRAADAPVDGSCNLTFNVAQGLIKFNLLSGEGASGSLHVYDITFETAAAAPLGAVSLLTITVQNMVDSAGAALRWQTENGAITVVGGPVDVAQILVGAPETDGVFTISQGGTLAVPVWISDAVDLGAATIALAFDPARVQALGCTMHLDGVDGGNCDVKHGQVQANIIAANGITGTLPVFTISFAPADGAVAGLNSPLTLDVINFADHWAEPLPWRVRPGRLEIVPGDMSALPLISVGPGAATDPLPLAQDGQVTVTVNISEVTNLGAATLAVNYDPAVVTAVTCRPVGALDSINCAVGSGAITVSLLAAIGFTGSTPVVELVFRSADAAAPGDQTPLSLAVTNFSDAAGSPLLFQLANSALVITAPVGAPVQAILRLNRPVYDSRSGERIWVSLQAILDAAALPHGLDVASMQLRYDPAVLRPVACVVNNSAFMGGACNPAYAADGLRFSVFGGNGVTGTVTLADIQFEAIGQSGDYSSLIPVVEQLIAVGGVTPTYRTERSEVQISADGDGVPDLVEDGAPNDGDGNGDGIPDAQQPHVTSLPNLIDNSYLTLVAPPTACLKNVQFVANPSPADTPYGWAFPLGFIDFTVGCIAPGSAATVTLLLHDNGAQQIEQFFIYARAVAPPENGWRPFPFVDGTGAVFAGDRIDLYLADGLRGDDDAAQNGEIVFLGAPARSGAAVSVVPLTLNIAEKGANASYRVTLLARPAAPVTITTTTSGEALATPTQLFFAVEAWSVVQTVTVSAVEDEEIEGGHQDEVQHTIASLDGMYNLLAMPSVVVLITDAPPGAIHPQRTYLPSIMREKSGYPGNLYLPIIVQSTVPERIDDKMGRSSSGYGSPQH